MAFHPQLFLRLRFLPRFNKIRYLSPSFLPFSTQIVNLNDKPSSPPLDESRILTQLSDLLPISYTPLIVNSYKPLEEHANTRDVVVADLCLSPEEKLRGVFLQKLNGKSAIEAALDKTGVHLSLDVVASVLNWGNLGGDAMVTFFNWAIKNPLIPKDIYSYNLLIKALGRRKYIDFVLKVLVHLKREGITVNLETLSIVIDSFLRAQRVYKAIQMFGTCEEYGFERNTESLNVILQCLCKRSHVGAANSYFNTVKGKIPFNSMTYTVMIGGWSRYGRVSEMEGILEAMIEDGFDADCSTFSFLLEGLGRAGRFEAAVKVFNGLKEEKECVIDTKVYNSMISNFISQGNLDECMKYYRDMASNNSDPDIDTYTKMISTFIKARKVADALEMFDEMLGRGIVPSTGTITSFIEPLCSFGPPHAAMMIYKKARKSGCKISLTAYKLLLMRLSRFGKCGMVLTLWDEMQESGHSSDMEVYEYVINGLCNIGQLENAVLVMEESLRKGFCPSRLIYSKLNNNLLASGKVERAYRLFLKIKLARCNENARKFWRSNGWHF